MPTQKEFEQKLQDAIFPDLEKGRKDFDLPHTRAVVIKLKEIIQHSPDLKIDRTVLLIAAYAHDWGYAEIYGGKGLGNYSNMIQKKTEHMEIGTRRLRDLLKDAFFDFLTDQQKNRAIYLVGAHDKLSELKDIDELILMEADTLGGLDTTLVIPTISAEENERYLRGVEKNRIPKFITEYGKKEAQRLIKVRTDYYKGLFSI